MGLLDKFKTGMRTLRVPKLLREPGTVIKETVVKSVTGTAKEQVDAYVNQKLTQAKSMAAGLADETIEKVKLEATIFLDVIEKRIDEKIESLERKLEERLQRELHWKLVGLRLTLIFVVVMSLVSLAYFILKKHFG